MECVFLDSNESKYDAPFAECIFLDDSYETKYDAPPTECVFLDGPHKLRECRLINDPNTTPYVICGDFTAVPTLVFKNDHHVLDGMNFFDGFGENFEY